MMSLLIIHLQHVTRVLCREWGLFGSNIVSVTGSACARDLRQPPGLRICDCRPVGVCVQTFEEWWKVLRNMSPQLCKKKSTTMPRIVVNMNTFYFCTGETQFGQSYYKREHVK